MITNYFLLIIIMMLSACNTKLHLPGEGEELATAEEPCGFVQNSFGQRVSWKNKLPVQIIIDPSVPAELSEPLKSAAFKWNETLHKELIAVSVATANSDPKKDGSSKVYYMENWSGQSAQEAVTSLYWAGNSALEADIRVNAKNYTYYVETPQTYNQVHFESLMIHELGHVLGLQHKNSASVMLTTLDYGTIRNKITSTDIASLKCEY